MTDAEQPEKAPPVANEDERAQLEDLVTRAAAKDAIKDFNAAAELYSEATELQVKLNGEMSLDNADLLYAYGKALYNVAVSKSDVLGAKVAGEPQAQPNTTGGSSGSAKPASTSENLIENSMASGMAKKEASASEKELSENKQSKPFFQFTGDENFDESDSEDEDEEAKAGADDEDEDDFANAFEVLDLARILYQKQMDEADGGDQKGKSTEVPSDIKRLKERLADTYDLQAEISLEAERFLDAVTDLRTALDLRLSIFPLEDPSVAECHYKLSLALEFGAVSKAEESDQNDSHGPPKVDEDMRKEAATQMEKAIESCRARMAQEQKKLDSGEATDEDKATAMKRKISNVKEIVADMEQRLVDLRRPPVSIEEQDKSDEAMLKGILGQIVGQSPAQQKSQLNAATEGAKDLSAFVKRKPAGAQSSRQSESNKRPAEQTEESDTKRARVSDEQK